MPKILVVDDNEQNRKVCQVALEDRFQLFFAASGEEGLVKARDLRPDVILLDILMPGMDGFEVCREFRRDEKTRNLKIIFLSARGEVIDKVTGLEGGADDYVTKPFDVPELLARIAVQLRLKRSEDLLKASLSKAEHWKIIGQMLTGTAHDMNNILSRINNEFPIKRDVADIRKIFKESESLAAAEESLKCIERSAQRIGDGVEHGKRMLQGLIRFAKSGSEVDQKVQHLAPLIPPILDILERQIEKVELKLEIDEVPPTKCNAMEFQQIVLNLATNAIQAMKTVEKRKLTIRLRATDAWVKFSVSDTGMGIPENVQPKIFNDFFTTKPKGEGTGVGLPTINKILKAHEGKIEFKTKVGQGTTFTVSLRAARLS